MVFSLADGHSGVVIGAGQSEVDINICRVEACDHFCTIEEDKPARYYLVYEYLSDQDLLAQESILCVF